MHMCARQRRREELLPGFSNTPFIVRTGRAHWQPKVIISMPRGSLKSQLSGWRPEAGIVCVSSLLMKTLP